MFYMREEIIISLNNPEQLERLYRSDKLRFRRTFKSLYPQIEDTNILRYWKARLDYSAQEMVWGNTKDLLIIILASLVAGVIAKLPALLNINEEFFYPRNIGFILFPFLAAYFAWKNNLGIAKIAVISGVTLASAIFINALPDVQNSDTLILPCIHLLFVLWCVLALAFTGGNMHRIKHRLEYLKFNGDLVVITTLIVIAGGILTAITIGLFSLIGINIEEFYFKNIVVFGLPAAPILGTYLTQTNPHLVGKVSPVIAKIFSPLVLVMLLVYLVAMVYSGKDPYNDREFLIMFNVLLIGVMAIIFFSVAEGSNTAKTTAEYWILFLLSLVTIIVNGIALSAIIFRISEWGITPNRIAVLGANVLILTNLVLVAMQLFRTVVRKDHADGVRKVIALYLPVYLAWAVIVTFVFPVVFGFK